MKKVQLERILQSLEAVPSPRPDIEQYPTPAGLAAEVAYIAHGKGDIVGHRVLDAGCGNGVLGIAAKLLGAGEVVGVDLDPLAIQVAERNAKRAHVGITWRHADVSAVEGPFDTVLMNPPFGSQTRHADLPFLDRALAVASTVYSFHNGVTEDFVRRRIESLGGRITDRVDYAFPLPRAFRFHRDEVRRIPVVLLRTEAAKG
ncbi:MAG TPA: methyltransferase [Thermoplasmata archaeon]|nr:methyltransferase [Thermoplasmata archaeon]